MLRARAAGRVLVNRAAIASRPSGFDPSRKSSCTPRRGQSFPRPAFGVALLTLLRLPS
jgi:hypothetical protein